MPSARPCITAPVPAPTFLSGGGAGPDPTASAVVADLVDTVRALTSDPENRVPHLAFQPDALVDLRILPMEAVHTAYYLRMRAVDEPGVLAEITRILGEQQISIEAFIQREPDPEAHDVDIILLTQRVLEGNMNKALDRIEALDVVLGRVTRIRMETLKR
jgi:homoserine dehydrogenase